MIIKKVLSALMLERLRLREVAKEAYRICL
jgi:hypothetical protein